ncbi:unnamed protein product [Rotaria sp. Silwood2]|nr:unnamed protein product [Rotaria sp. Silwood2]
MGSCTSAIGCQYEYIRSIPFVLKLIEFVCDLLAVSLCGAGPTLDEGNGRRGFFLFVSILALIITVVLLILCLIINLKAIFNLHFWLKLEFGWCAFIALFYFIASIVIATAGKASGLYGAAAFFGFAAFITYVADAVHKFIQFRKAPLEERYVPNPPSGNP